MTTTKRFLVAEDLGRSGRAWREADYESTDLETVIQDLRVGNGSHPTATKLNRPRINKGGFLFIRGS
jgi:hypothetical protein